MFVFKSVLVLHCTVYYVVIPSLSYYNKLLKQEH